MAWNKGLKGAQVAWNKGLKGAQVAWNKGVSCSTETKDRISKTLLNNWDELAAHSVYYLVDPQTGIPRYVGFSKRPAYRLECHLNSKRDTHKNRWIQSLTVQGLQPTLLIKCIVASRLEACRIERLLIEHLRANGIDLTNTTNGGDGGDTNRGRYKGKNSKLHGRRYTAERREAHKIAMQRPEVRARMGASVKASMTPEVRAKMSAAKKGKPWTEQQRQAITASLTLEIRAQINEKLRGRHFSLETRAKMTLGQQRRRSREAQEGE